MKKCTKCKVKKELTEFYKDKKSKDGLNYHCKVCRLQYEKNRLKENPNLLKDYYYNNQSYFKQYYQNNKDDFYQRSYEWIKSNPSYTKKYNDSNPHIIAWRNLIKRTLNGNSTILGYSAQELKEHLDKQGMDWSKHQIDHKIPLSWFKEDTPPSIVHDLRNLHPLTEEENKSKSNKFASPADDSYIQEIKDYLKIKL